MRFRKYPANSDRCTEDKSNICTMCNNYSLLSLIRRLITIAVIIILYGVFGHRVCASTDNDTSRKPPSRLKPRFLNGHYVTWPTNIDGTMSFCDADTPPLKPPPHIYYVPDNVVFTRMQMAGDRAFIVSPRYK